MKGVNMDLALYFLNMKREQYLIGSRHRKLHPKVRLPNPIIVLQL